MSKGVVLSENKIGMKMRIVREVLRRVEVERERRSDRNESLL
jgi:hypothetical protein